MLTFQTGAGKLFQTLENTVTVFKLLVQQDVYQTFQCKLNNYILLKVLCFVRMISIC